MRKTIDTSRIDEMRFVFTSSHHQYCSYKFLHAFHFPSSLSGIIDIAFLWILFYSPDNVSIGFIYAFLIETELIVRTAIASDINNEVRNGMAVAGINGDKPKSI